MALKPCKECGKEVSTAAKTCPHCGTPGPTGGIQTGGCANRGAGCLLAVIVIGVIVALLGDGYEAPTTDGRVAPTTPMARAACLDVPRATLDQIEAGLDVSGGGALRRGKAVSSGAHRNAYFVAAEIDGPGLEGEGDVGLWLVTSLESGGMILAVPHTATEFSIFPDASTTDARARRSDPGAREAEDCLRP